MGCVPSPPAKDPGPEAEPGAGEGDDSAGLPVTSGVVGADCGIGGSDSRRDAPKDDDGLNALSGVKPVVCGFSAPFAPPGEDREMEGAEEVNVEPVGCGPREEEKRESEKVEFVVPVALL